MPNKFVSQLPVYTGNTEGVVLVMNTSGDTATYKVTRENLIDQTNLIGRLPVYSGDTSNVHLMMNDSGDTLTYKVDRETLLSGYTGFDLNLLETSYVLSTEYMLEDIQGYYTGSTLNNSDDNSIEIELPWYITFLGQQYSTVWLGTNSYLTFGSGNDTYNPIMPVSIPQPGIFIASGDNSLQNYLYGVFTNGENTEFRIRYIGNIDPQYENNHSGYPGIIWEAVFVSGVTDQIKIIVGNNNRNPGGVFGISDGTKWIEQIPGLPLNSNNGSTINTFTVKPITGSTKTNLKFTGPGVTTNVTGETMYVNIDPLIQYGISINEVPTMGDLTVISSNRYGLSLTTGLEESPIMINPKGDVYIEPNAYGGLIKNGYSVFVNGATSLVSDPINISNIILNEDSTIITTATKHGMHDYNSKLRVTEVNGTTELNGNIYYVNSLDDFNVRLYSDQEKNNPIDGSVLSQYIESGIITQYTDGGDVNISGGGGNTYGEPGKVTVSVNNNTWEFNKKGTLSSPIYKTYKATVTQTTQLNLINIYDLPNGEFTLGEYYTITEYHEGDDFTNIGKVISGDMNTTGCVFSATGTTANNYNNGSHLTSYGNLVVSEFENDLGYDVTWSFFDGIYMVQSDIFNQPNTKVLFKTSSIFPFFYSSEPLSMTAFIVEMGENNKVCLVGAYDHQNQNYVFNGLYNSPFEFSVYNNTPVIKTTIN